MVQSTTASISISDQEKDISKRVGATVRMLRLIQRVKQKEIAAYLEISAQQFQNMERGVSFISAARLLLIIKYMDISSAQFYTCLHKKFGRRHELFRANAYSRISLGLIDDFLCLPEEKRELIRALIHSCANEPQTSNIPAPQETH